MDRVPSENFPDIDFVVQGYEKVARGAPYFPGNSVPSLGGSSQSFFNFIERRTISARVEFVMQLTVNQVHFVLTV